MRIEAASLGSQYWGKGTFGSSVSLMWLGGVLLSSVFGRVGQIFGDIDSVRTHA